MIRQPDGRVRDQVKRLSRNGPAEKAAGLLRKLSGSSALPAYIRQLPASTVARLIDEVGPEDSHEIVAAMDAQQFRETMSIALWSSSGPGQDEVPDIDQFVRWIGLWLQDGAVMVSRRIADLGEDFIVMCFEQLLSAVDRTVCGVERQGVDVGNYVLFPKQQKHWPCVVEALVALWNEMPDFTLRLLRRCSHERSILNETSEEQATHGSLREDLIAERGAGRAQLGHVSPMHASLFLSAAKTSRLEDLCDQREYDLNTAAYLQKAERLVDVPAEESAQERQFAALDDVLRDVGILEPRAEVTLLTDQRAAGMSMLLEHVIAALASDHPNAASKRMRELAYLANVLMAGAESQGRRYTETRAARVVMATANLGATYLLRESVSDASDLVRQDPGIVRLFQVGFNLLASVPVRCCQALYVAKEVQSRRRGYVVYLEMEEILGTSVLTDLVNEGRFPEAKSVIDELSAVLDSAACVALRILIDPIPAYPLVLGDAGASGGTYVERGHRPISTLEDFERIGAFLAALAEYCGS